jgi:hypothetical protein
MGWDTLPGWHHILECKRGRFFYFYFFKVAATSEGPRNGPSKGTAGPGREGKATA